MNASALLASSWTFVDLRREDRAETSERRIDASLCLTWARERSGNNMLTVAVCVAWIDWTMVPGCADPLYMLPPPVEPRPAFAAAPLLPAPLRKEEAQKIRDSTS